MERHDKHKRLLETEIEIERIPVYVHNGCRKQLINDVGKRKLQVRCEDPCTLPTKQRKSSSRFKDIEFEWKKHCFTCSEICDEFIDKWYLCDVKRRYKPESTREKILELVSNKSNELSLKVYGRVPTCSDLPAVEARYHTDVAKSLIYPQYLLHLSLVGVTHK